MSDHHQFVVHLTHSLFFLYKVDFRQTISLLSIENLKHNKMLDPLGQAWQSGSALAA